MSAAEIGEEDVHSDHVFLAEITTECSAGLGMTQL